MGVEFSTCGILFPTSSASGIFHSSPMSIVFYVLSVIVKWQVNVCIILWLLKDHFTNIHFSVGLLVDLNNRFNLCFLQYFASSGLKTRLNLLNDWTTALFCVAVIFVACVGKIVGCALAAKFSGFPWRESFSIGVLMNTKGLVWNLENQLIHIEIW